MTKVASGVSIWAPTPTPASPWWLVAQYEVIAAAPEGGLSPDGDQECTCNFRLQAPDGAVVDSTFETARTMVLTPDKAIGGLKEALQLMAKGDHWRLTVPPGSVPTDRSLVLGRRQWPVRGERWCMWQPPVRRHV